MAGLDLPPAQVGHPTVEVVPGQGRADEAVLSQNDQLHGDTGATCDGVDEPRNHVGAVQADSAYRVGTQRRRRVPGPRPDRIAGLPNSEHYRWGRHCHDARSGDTTTPGAC